MTKQQQTSRLLAMLRMVRWGEAEEIVGVGGVCARLRDCGWTVLVVMGLMSIVACKDPGDDKLSELRSEDCLLDEVIQSLEINVEVPNPQHGYLDFDYEFANETKPPVALPGFKVPFVASVEQTVDGSNGMEVVGHHLTQGLIVKERIRFLRAEYTSECQPTTELSSAPPLQNHTITVLVNGQTMIESEFELIPEIVTDGCESDQSARKVVLEILDLNSNPTFAQRRSECPGGIPAGSTPASNSAGATAM